MARMIDAVQVLHNINLHHKPTPVSEFESGFNNGLNQAMWEITHAPTLTQPNEPLTLEQLREMEGKPVWVERNEEPYDGKWYIVDYADTKNPDKTLYTKEGVTYSDYSKYFTAYAYPPAHIDREAWTSHWVNSMPVLGAGDLETRCAS